jgi:hypothetical protein
VFWFQFIKTRKLFYKPCTFAGLILKYIALPAAGLLLSQKVLFGAKILIGLQGVREKKTGKQEALLNYRV